MRRTSLMLATAAWAAAAACAKPKPEAAAGAPGAANPPAAAALPGDNDSLPVVVLETTKGRIVMQFDRKKAPQTVANILNHVNHQFYDGLTFHRVERGFVIQAGILTAAGMEKQSSEPPVPNEADNGLKNVRGSVALARMPDPNSGGVQFYINLGNNRALDFKDSTAAGFGYCVFGKVIQGMDVVDRISVVPVTLQGNYANIPVEPVVITRAFVQEAK
ncbi:MAG TPA: peptidylprolyl isomerase [Gemmatimonadales bacterium]|nr:peptidylprolyl isomerase [Gemmatimonadales bacterium]